jgi:hypothetical protein
LVIAQSPLIFTCCHLAFALVTNESERCFLERRLSEMRAAYK